jgi:hypothetical protein
MFCAPGLVFSGNEGVGSRFHVLRSLSRFRRYRGRRLLFSYFVLPDLFSAVPRASGPVFLFCAPELNFSGTGVIRSHFHVLRTFTRFRRCRVRRVPFLCFACRTRFQRYRRRRVPFSCFALPDSFSVTPRASGPVFMFCTPGHILRRGPFSCFERPDSFSAVSREIETVFMFYATGLVFGGTKGVGSHFHVLRSWTGFRRYGGR